MKYNYIHQKNHPFIDSYFEIMNLKSEQANKRDLILPDCTPGLLFVKKGGFYRFDGKETKYFSEGKAYLFGQKTKAVQYHFPQKRQNIFGVKLMPTSIYNLFGFSSQEITDKVIDMDNLVNNINIIHPSNFDKSKLKGILFFLERIKYKKSNSSKLMQLILNDIYHSNGNISIQSLKEKYSISYKKIERLFKQQIGIPPKLYSRIIRFNHCIKYITNNPDSTISSIAHENGFFDQMHFVKDTRLFTNLTPSELFQNKSYPLEENHLNYLVQRGY